MHRIYLLIDSEPLFGLWFESTLVAPDAADSGLVRATAGADNTDSADTASRPHQAIVPDKAEPYSVSIWELGKPYYVRDLKFVRILVKKRTI